MDTYNIEEAVKTAVKWPVPNWVACASTPATWPPWPARNQLDALGATNTTITVTNDLDEYALAALQTAPVDSYGVGTMLVTGSGAPTCAMVYKLTEREGDDGTMVPVMKKSKDKATVPGRKLAFRSYEYALAEAEHVISGSKRSWPVSRPNRRGRTCWSISWTTAISMRSGRAMTPSWPPTTTKALSELPITAQSLMKGELVILRRLRFSDENFRLHRNPSALPPYLRTAHWAVRLTVRPQRPSPLAVSLAASLWLHWLLFPLWMVKLSMVIIAAGNDDVSERRDVVR